MRFSPYDWSEVTKPGEFQEHSGRLELRASAPVAIIVRQLGVDAVASYGAHHVLEVSGPFEWRVADDKSPPLVYVFTPNAHVVSAGDVGESFTNLDMREHQGGNFLAVSRQLRQMRLEHMAFLREAKALRAAAGRVDADFETSPAEPPAGEQEETGSDEAGDENAS